MKKMSRTVKQIAPAVLALALLAVIPGLRNHAAARFESVRTDADRFYLPPPLWLRLFSLGFNEAVADLVWIKSIIHFGKNFTIKDQERFVTNFVESAIELDPRFRSIYVAGAVLTMYQDRGKPSKKTLLMAIDILERGHKEFPNDGNIAFNLGFAHYSDMWGHISTDLNDPETKFHLERGRKLIRKSALMPGSPPYAALYSLSLLSEETRADLRIEHLQALLVSETNPEIRKSLIEMLHEELGAAAKRDIETTSRLQEAWRSEMPFVPYDLYMLIRSKYSSADILDPMVYFDRILGIEAPKGHRAP
jgi:hypothetical protein